MSYTSGTSTEKPTYTMIDGSADTLILAFEGDGKGLLKFDVMGQYDLSCLWKR